ncbi:hypothetical protein RhiirA4_476341 [Rhizophagus irregularis]|uniref:Uncharacterized protein n=1 Tax=Rhizophagus irregularis TaxID=588596 RepID=A0A2I1HBG5_9GLOM|nr:hypothetical protein RhiirA4_476341 [Rhizophagus irregularis]
MNATSFHTNISRNLQSLEIQIKLISTIATTSDESKIKLEEIQKSISDITTLIQQQQNSNILNPRTINNLHGISSESDDAKLLFRLGILQRGCNQHDKDSDGLIEEEFMFDYSKHFIHKVIQKILKAYISFL